MPVISHNPLHQRLGNHLGVELLLSALLLQTHLDQAPFDSLADRHVLVRVRVMVHALGVVEDTRGLGLKSADALLGPRVDNAAHNEAPDLLADVLGRGGLVREKVGDGGEDKALVDGLAYVVDDVGLEVPVGTSVLVEDSRLDGLRDLGCNNLKY